MTRAQAVLAMLRHRRRTIARGVLLACGLCAVVLAISVLGVASCSQTTTNVPIRSFEFAQKMDVVCLQVNGPDAGAPIPAIPQPQAQCASDPINVLGSEQTFHLFALVTQLVRGEVAVVDLTAGNVVDVDRSTPGVNFLPVGAQPTDIASSADGTMTYVATAQINSPAIFALPSTRVLGDSQAGTNGLDASSLPAPPVPNITTWPSCALPEAPGPIAIVPTAVSSDGGAPEDAGADAGPGYVLTVVLRGDGVQSAAKVVTIDPAPLIRGAALDAGPGPAIAPGSLEPCPILGATELANTFGTVTAAGPAWGDGVPYADGGIVAPVPAGPLACSPGADGGAPAPGAVDAGPALPPPLAHASAAVRSGQFLYVADMALPIIHVIDLSTPTAPREVEPLRATSLADPTRRVSVGQLAVSPATRSYQTFLYAIDETDSPSSIIVYEVTDPTTSSHLPLTRPHPELNPFQARDRLVFGTPVATLSFARHDWPLIGPNGAVSNYAAQSGLLCNPNPNAIVDGGNPTTGPFRDPGAYYTVNVTNNPEQITSTTLSAWPSRLRGVFGFATLSNGTIVTIDVDDWDAPCRRPDPMGGDAGGPPSDVAPIEPGPSPPSSDINPYHVPDATNPAYADVTSQEGFFPVSAPHRVRSYYPLKDDVTAGNHAPFLTQSPELFTLESATLSGVGGGSAVNPLLLPTGYYDPMLQTNTPLADPYAATIPGYATSPNVRFAWEDPLVQIDQNWTVTYEGALPTLQGFSFNIDTGDHFQTLTLTTGTNLLCRTGVEDLDQGTARAKQALQFMTMAPAGSYVIPDQLDSRLVDYIQIADDIRSYGVVLNSEADLDPYWSEDNASIADGGTESCWAGVGMNGTDVTDPMDRYNLCLQTFGPATDQEPGRDFPILQAYGDHFVIGTFSPYDQIPPRVAPPIAAQKAYAGNPSILKLVKCCFHNQFSVNVRAGGEWVAVGSSSGLFHHMITDGTTSRCVQGCDPTQVLLNARSVGLVAPGIDGTGARLLPGCNGTQAATCTAPTLPDRNNPLAMRNPMFAYLTFNGTATLASTVGADGGGGGGADAGGGAGLVESVPPRDDVWKFSTRGEFTPLTINIASSSTAVSPQSMFFVAPMGQMAVVDGSSQGLIMIDLNVLAEAHTPYY